MSRRFPGPGPGPVFAFECLTASRRPQLYATRALFVSALLVAIGTAWRSNVGWGPMPPAQVQARIASAAWTAIVGTQLVLVMLAAPAATAGAICIDRARGTLAHVMVTDLTDAEIVLGKLAARLIPVLSLVGSTIPVALLLTFLGGIDPEDILGAYAITVAVAVLGCSLALTLSIWARKTHEVLSVTYLIWLAWILAAPVWMQLRGILGGGYSYPDWAAFTDPFQLLTIAFQRRPTSAGEAGAIAAFIAICLLASTGLLSLAVRSVRRTLALETARAKSPKRPRWKGPDRRVQAAFDWLGLRLPGPSLDADPVLWREWHRNAPSNWARWAWGLYFAGAVFFTALAILAFDIEAQAGLPGGRLALWVNGIQVAVGILLLSVGASTSLAEERARGSLDVLMATPLPTSAIVRGKWLGAFRRVPWLLVLPTPLAASLAWRSGYWLNVGLLMALILAYGAFITSLGLALATWISRLGRAVAVCVAVDVLLTVGWFFLVMILTRGPQQGEQMLGMSPFGGPAILTAETSGIGPTRLDRLGTEGLLVAYFWDFAAILAYTTAALALFLATLRSFDRCLGRASESPHLRRIPKGQTGRAA